MGKLKTETSEIKAHAKFGASSSERWLNCPGSIRLSEKAPEQPESPWAAEGTKAHACFEFLLKNRRNLSAAIRTAYKQYDRDMVDHAVDAVHWIMERAAGPKYEYVLLDPDHPQWRKIPEIRTEARVNASPFTTKGQFGTLDACIIEDFGRLTVIDYKYGAGVVREPGGDDEMGDSQLVYYALAIAHEFHFNFTEVELVIIQPRAWHDSGETVRSHILSIEDLEAWVPVFQKGVRRAERENAKLKSGPWCRFCPAGIICPQIKTKAMEEARIVFSDSKGLQSIPEPMLIPAADLSKALDAAERLQSWIGKVKDHCSHVLQKGGKIPGWKLVQKNSPRRWKNETIVYAEALRDLGDKAFTQRKVLSPAQIEEAYGSDKATKKKIEAWVNERTVKESSGTTMVKESDSRTAINPIDQVFTTIDVAEIPNKKRKKK